MSTPVPSPAGAQGLTFYETRSVVLSSERVARLASESYWMTRLAQQSQLTLLRRGKDAPGDLDPLFAAVSTWLPQAPVAASDWVFVLKTGALGAWASLRPAEGRPALDLQPLGVDRVSSVAADDQAQDRWRPRTSFRHAGFPGGVDEYCRPRAPICVAPFAIDAPGRSVLTVTNDGAYTTFHVDRVFANSPEGIPLVQYLGAVGVTALSTPPDYERKDMGDFALEQESSDALGPVNGVDSLTAFERIAVKTAVSSYVQSGTHSAEADVVLPSGPAGEQMLYTLRFFPRTREVSVERLGSAENLLPAAGPRSEVRGIPGFPVNAGRTRLLEWLRMRYPSLSVKGSTVAQIVASADQAIDERSGTARWFQTNYDIAILDADAADRRLAEVHDRPSHKRDDLHAFSSAELRSLEAVLQRVGDRGLALLRGTALVRQRSSEEASPFGDLGTHVQIAGHTFTRSLPPRAGEQTERVQATVVIYDIAHAQHRFVGGYAPDGVLRVYPAVAEVIAHELAHVISRRAPIQQQFEELIESVGATPFTRYAASNPQSEFFPEAFAIYLLDPAWISVNYPELYARVRAYARNPRPGAL
jgi:hypothetical protein